MALPNTTLSDTGLNLLKDITFNVSNSLANVSRSSTQLTAEGALALLAPCMFVVAVVLVVAWKQGAFSCFSRFCSNAINNDSGDLLANRTIQA